MFVFFGFQIKLEPWNIFWINPERRDRSFRRKGSKHTSDIFCQHPHTHHPPTHTHYKQNQIRTHIDVYCIPPTHTHMHFFYLLLSIWELLGNCKTIFLAISISSPSQKSHSIPALSDVIRSHLLHPPCFPIWQFCTLSKTCLFLAKSGTAGEWILIQNLVRFRVRKYVWWCFGLKPL